MRLHRFYVVLQPLGEEVVIDDVSKIKQWTKVFRYTVGDSVILFNGEGLDVHYSVTSISAKLVHLKRTEQSPSYMPTKAVTLYLSIIKKNLFELVVEKATELGITKIVPIVSERSLQKNLNYARLHVIAVEATEQCGRGDIPAISLATSLTEALSSIKEDSCTVALDKDGLQWNSDAVRGEITESKNINLFIGPEGGWGVQEMKMFEDRKATKMSLGDTTLRAETAAIVASFFSQI